jgi:chromosome segregation ATPase
LHHLLVRSHREKVLDLHSEINGYRKQLRESTEHTENLASIVDRISGEIEFIKEQIEGLKTKKEKIRQSYAMHNDMLLKTEENLKAVNKERESRQTELSTLDKQAIHLSRVIKETENRITDILYDQVSLQRGTHGTKRDTTKLQAQIFENEGVVSTLKNELAQMSFDIQSLQRKNQELKKSGEIISQEYAKTTAVIDKMENDVARQIDEISKKTTELDLLNKKYDQLLSKNLVMNMYWIYNLRMNQPDLLNS